MQEQSLFIEALEKEDPAERAAFLERACAGDAALRQRIERLLARHQEDSGFLEAPATPPLLPPRPEAAADHPELPATADLATFREPVREGPGTVIGPYKLLEQIGEGGFGIVFLAEQQAPVRRKVALKVLKPGMDSREVSARFEQERQALALMDHPHIAKVLDAGQTAGGRPFFVMDLVRGVPVTDYCDQAQLTARERLELFGQVCQAVQHAHQKGIIHRDLKPSNVLVTLQDGKAVPKVIDFGIAKALGQQLTDKTLHTGFAEMIGTPLYMSPEQAARSGLDVDTRSDIYSLGVLLYELLTGTTPFDRERLREVGYDEWRRLLREEEPPRPSTRLSTLGGAVATVAAQRQSDPRRLSQLLKGELDWIVMKCLEKDRGRRYESASALAQDIERYLHDEPVLACPPSRWYRLGKVLRKHRAAVLTAAAFVGLLLAGAAVSTWLALRATQAEGDALQGWAEAEREGHAAKEARQQTEKALKQALRDRNAARTAEGKAKNEKKEADRQRDLADKAEKETRVVFNFFVRDMLEAGAPEQARGRQVTVVEVLKRAARRAETAFAGEPAVEAQVRISLGRTFYRLGLYAEAERHLRRALALHGEAYGPADVRSLIATNELAVLLTATHRLDEAETLIRRCWEGHRRLAGPDGRETLTALHNLAGVLEKRGRPAEAEPLRQQVLDGRRRVLGERHPDTLTALNNLGSLLLVHGRLDEAERLLRRCLKDRLAGQGLEHPDTLTTMTTLGLLLGARGQPAMQEAEALLRRCCEVSRRVCGPEHPTTLTALHNLGVVLRNLGKPADAEPLLRQVLESSRRTPGPDHPITLSALGSLGMVLLDQHKLDEAEPLLRQCLDDRRRIQGPEHPETLIAANNLAVLFGARGKPAEAELLLRQVWKGIRGKRGADHPEALKMMGNLVECVARQGKLVETVTLVLPCLEAHLRVLGMEHPETKKLLPLAEAASRQLLEARRRELDADHPATANSMNHLAALLVMQARFAEAEPLFGGAVRGFRKVRPPRPPDVARELAVALEGWAGCLWEIGQARQAAEVAREVLQIERDRPAADPRDVARLLTLLGAALTMDKRAKEAEPLLREALKIRSQALPPGHYQTALTQSMLGGCLSALGRHADAEPLLLAGYEGLRAAKRAPSFRTRQALDRLVQLYEAWGKPKQAAAWRAKQGPLPRLEQDRPRPSPSGDKDRKGSDSE
jgi:serine/threonine protein kinase